MGCLFSLLGILAFAVFFALLALNVANAFVQLTTFASFIDSWGINGAFDTWVAGFYWLVVLKPLDWLFSGFPVLSHLLGDLTRFPNLNSVLTVAAMLAYPACIGVAAATIATVITKHLGRFANWILPVLAAPLLAWSVGHLGLWLFATQG